MIAGVEDKKYAEKAAKRKSTKVVEAPSSGEFREALSEVHDGVVVQEAELHEVKKHEAPKEEAEASSVRLQSSNSKRKLQQAGAGADDPSSIEIEKIEDPSSPRGIRGARARPTEPAKIRPIYMDTKAIDDQKSATISFQPASAAELLEMAESAADMYNNESNSVFTGPVCCTFLFLLVFIYIGTAVAVIVLNCPQQSLLDPNSALIVAVVTFVFAAVAMALFVYVRVRRDALGRCALPCTTLFVVVGVLALGIMLVLTLVVNITTCPPTI
jgi:hypothetical protein